VEIHDDWFPDSQTRDTEWLRLCAERRWVAITKDDRIRYHELEKQALIAGGVAVFTLTTANISGTMMAKILVEARPRMDRFVRKHTPPYLAYVTRSAAIGRVIRDAELRLHSAVARGTFRIR
jgi:PIN like domain